MNHPPFTVIFILTVSLTLAPCVSQAQSSLIERVLNAQESIVSIQAQRVEVDPKPTAEAVLLPNGEILVAAQTRAAMAEQSGAGIIIDAAGFIVTNTHTVVHSQFIFATLHNGLKLPARVASVAPNSDFTILKIDAPMPLKPLTWADSDHVNLGDDIISIGNSPLLKETISGGVIKGIGRNEITGMVEIIETTVNLFKGDSGGPILDRHGNFLGIVAAKNMKVEHSSFIIPSNKIRLHFLTFLQGAQR